MSEHSSVPAEATHSAEAAPLRAGVVEDAAPTQAGRALLRLQRQAGNQAVQRLLRARSPIVQRQTVLVQRQIKAVRFQGNSVLQDIDDGRATLTRANAASPPTLAVRLIQQALRDIFGAGVSVNGGYDEATAEAVNKLNKQQSDEFGQASMRKLDSYFVGYGVEARVAKGGGGVVAPRPIGVEEHANIETAMIPPIPKTETGERAEFNWDNTRAYQRAAVEIMLGVIDRLSEGLAAKSEDRSSETVMSWETIEKVAEQAKSATDALFGTFRQQPALKKDVNLTDRFDTTTKALSTMNEAQQLEVADEVAAKYVRNSNEIAELNHAQHVDLGNEEHQERLIKPITFALSKVRTKQLLEMHRHQPGSNKAGTGNVTTQRFLSDDFQADVWRKFATLVHEYIHTLAPPEFYTWVFKLRDDQSFTLTEGITDAFTRIVMANLSGPYAQLKEKYQPGPYRGTYAAAADRAEQMIALIGIRNAYAGYFLAQTHLFGVQAGEK